MSYIVVQDSLNRRLVKSSDVGREVRIRVTKPSLRVEENRRAPRSHHDRDGDQNKEVYIEDVFVV